MLKKIMEYNTKVPISFSYSNFKILKMHKLNYFKIIQVPIKL